MSKAPRKTKPGARGKDAENDRELRELALFLEEAPGFRLGLGMIDNVQTRETQLDRLNEMIASRPVFLTRLDLGKFPDEEQILQQLQNHLRENPAPEGKPPAVMIVGLEAHLDYRDLGEGKIPPQPILRNANIQRDAYPRLCPVPIVLWLLPSAETLFAKEAPDLWHWRSGTFRFSGPPGRRKKWEGDQIGMSLFESRNLPKSEKSDRISLLRDLLFELENASDRETRGNKARRAALLGELGLTYRLMSKDEVGREYSRKAVELYGEIGDRRNEMAALCDLGNSSANLRQFEKALEYWEQALAITREIKDRGGEGRILGNLGFTYASLGQLDKAIAYYEQGLAIAREVEDRVGEGTILGKSGSAYAHKHELEMAILHLEQSLAIAREIGDRPGEGSTLGNLGFTYSRMSQPEKAIGYYEQSLVIARELGDRRGEGIVLNNLGYAYANMNQFEKALKLLNEALQIGQEIKDSRIIDVASKGIRNVTAKMQG